MSLIIQFANYFNIFFLVTGIILSIKIISPIDPESSLIPFAIVLVMGMVGEGVEDIKKHIYDRTYNNSKSLIWKLNAFVVAKWKNLKIGSIVKIQKNEVIPADVLVIKSSAENGFCYLETSNLDGENALKSREAVPCFSKRIETDSDLEKLKGYLEVDPPDSNIYSAEGKIVLESDTNEKYFFNIDNILLRV